MRPFAGAGVAEVAGVADAVGVGDAVGVDDAVGVPEAVGVAVAPSPGTAATADDIGNSVAIATKAAASREDLLRTVLQSSIGRPARSCGPRSALITSVDSRDGAEAGGGERGPRLDRDKSTAARYSSSIQKILTMAVKIAVASPCTDSRRQLTCESPEDPRRRSVPLA
ncbi:hypothetical protein AB0B45_04030 [Nonomuraea sp. NPDC049152]|uniref:hypothetical protein n=1 Tax=Nonomuraea sp. NPDC049152 TaxID=3154350 RepID=UPI0033F09A43